MVYTELPSIADAPALLQRYLDDPEKMLTEVFKFNIEEVWAEINHKVLKPATDDGPSVSLEDLGL